MLVFLYYFNIMQLRFDIEYVLLLITFVLLFFPIEKKKRILKNAHAALFHKTFIQQYSDHGLSIKAP